MSTGRTRRSELQHLTVYGYIREIHKDIPDDLKDLCYQFYLKVFDQWDIEKCNDKLDVDAESGIIEAKSDPNKRDFVNAFGSIIVKKGDIESWKIKPLIRVSCIATTVGIAESCKASKDMDWSFAASKNRAGIGYDGVSCGNIYDGLNAKGVLRKIDAWYFPQEIVLTLDMSVDDDIDRKYGRLSMKKGDSKEVTIYDKIDMDKEYRLAVALLLTKEKDHHKIMLVQD